MAVSRQNARLMVDDLTGYNINMTEWEVQFVQDMDEYEDDEWTEEQRNKIEEIWHQYISR